MLGLKGFLNGGRGGGGSLLLLLQGELEGGRLGLGDGESSLELGPEGSLLLD